MPGPWLTLRAIDAAIAMAATQGTGTVTIRRSHHIACLAAYLKRVTDRGFMLLLVCSDPAGASVAPFGGVSPVFTPNPLAAGIPTAGDPILIDVSASYTTNGLTGRLHARGEKLPHRWLQDAQGEPTADPAVLFSEPKGTLLPLGGLEAGHKGYALALLPHQLQTALARKANARPAGTRRGRVTRVGKPARLPQECIASPERFGVEHLDEHRRSPAFRASAV